MPIRRFDDAPACQPDHKTDLIIGISALVLPLIAALLIFRSR